jgi:predicted adenine nucleotide alpha hydrolase (AANH) superfamily ATPase
MEILLHTCCGPCTFYPIKELRKEGHKVLVYFYNPNIHPLREFERRVEALEIAAKKFEFPVLWDESGYGLRDWLNKIGTRQEPEDRCPVCYRMRLEATAKKAVELGVPAFTTTLLYSRYQRHNLISDIGRELSRAYSIKFYYRDFRDGWVEGIEISKELGIYRQPYCGCIFSEEERYKNRAKRLQKKFILLSENIK